MSLNMYALVLEWRRLSRKEDELRVQLIRRRALFITLAHHHRSIELKSVRVGSK
jgi:hypothetical protein